MERCWSRCKLGPERIYWAVGVLYKDEIIADGYTRSVEEAEDRAKQIAGPDSHQWQAYVAARWHKRKVFEERKSRPPKSTGAQVRQYVYEPHQSDYDGHRYVLAYPILKMTQKRAY